MKCMAVLHGGMCHRTSTTHKSGNEKEEEDELTEEKRGEFLGR